MISRSAEQCFWLCRHLERIRHIAGFMSANQDYILDTSLDSYDQWFPFIIILGEEKRFLKLYGEHEISNSQLIQSYITWNEDNPISICEITKSARENARIIRDIISNDLWESINRFWLWIMSNKSHQLYSKDKLAFYKQIKKSIEHMYGQLMNSMLEDEAYYFMILGMMLERSSQTARILDIKSDRISFYEKSERGLEIETLYWLNLLKLFSAHEVYLKKNTVINRKKVSDFLIFEKSFPHSILYCLIKSKSICLKLKNATDGKENSELINLTLNYIKNSNIDSILKNGLSKFLKEIINQLSKICNNIEEKYFDPEALLKGFQP
jgi:uncharacterized alpha-E superfamily protein